MWLYLVHQVQFWSPQQKKYAVDLEAVWIGVVSYQRQGTAPAGGASKLDRTFSFKRRKLQRRGQGEVCNSGSLENVNYGANCFVFSNTNSSRRWQVQNKQDELHHRCTGRWVRNSQKPGDSDGGAWWSSACFQEVTKQIHSITIHNEWLSTNTPPSVSHL